MLRTRWGPSSYATAANGGRGRGRAQDDQQSSMRDKAMEEGRDLVKEATNKKAFFQLRLDLEGNRKQLGKGNIVSFLICEDAQGKRDVEKSDVSKILRVGGFTSDQVIGITMNDYRSNQIEVLFRDDVIVDTCEVERKVKAQGCDVIVSKFDHVEEFIMIYGLPLSCNMDSVKFKIEEAIEPFVKNVLEVSPCVYRDSGEDDFFKERYNGNWRVKVTPRMELQVPNYIVVGSQEQVMAKAVYTKKIGSKLEMCSDCFSTGHFKKQSACSGPVKWSEYCQGFRDDWERLSLAIEEDEQGDPALVNVDESRLATLNKTLLKNLEALEKSNDDLQDKVAGQTDLLKKIDDLSSHVQEVEMRSSNFEEELKNASEVNSELKQQMVVLQKENVESNEIRAHLEELQKERNLHNQSMVDLSYTKIMSQNVTVRNKTSQAENDDLEVANVMDKSDAESFEALESVIERNLSTPFHGFGHFSPPSGSDVLDGEGGGGEGGGEDGGESEGVSEGESESEGGDEDEDEGGDEDEVRDKRCHSASPGDRNIKAKLTHPHPDLGSKIWMDTISGRFTYVVDSKKNNKPGDFSYNLMNEDKEVTTFDLKLVLWDYLTEDVNVEESSFDLNVTQ